MSLPLVDFRGKITHETDCVLDAIHLATGRDRSEIARDALHAWAELKIHEASLDRYPAASARVCEGLPGASQGA
jgi:hypothetical protein